jgi:hypothetical protein
MSSQKSSKASRKARAGRSLANRAWSERTASLRGLFVFNHKQLSAKLEHNRNDPSNIPSRGIVIVLFIDSYEKKPLLKER